MLILVNLDTNYCGDEREFLAEIPNDWSETQIDNFVNEAAYDNAIENGSDEQAKRSIEEGLDDDEELFEMSEDDYESAVEEAMGVMSSWEFCDEADRERLIEEYGTPEIV